MQNFLNLNKQASDKLAYVNVAYVKREKTTKLEKKMPLLV